MTNERKIQILELLKTYLTENAHYGICETFSILQAYNNVYCTNGEIIIIQQFIYDNKPNKNNQYAYFMDNEKWIGKRFWWERICDYPETRKLRIDFIQALIDNIK